MSTNLTKMNKNSLPKHRANIKLSFERCYSTTLTRLSALRRVTVRLWMGSDIRFCPSCVLGWLQFEHMLFLLPNLSFSHLVFILSNSVFFFLHTPLSSISLPVALFLLYRFDFTVSVSTRYLCVCVTSPVPHRSRWNPISAGLAVHHRSRWNPISAGLAVHHRSRWNPISAGLAVHHRSRWNPISAGLAVHHRSRWNPISAGLAVPHRSRWNPISAGLAVHHRSRWNPISAGLAVHHRSRSCLTYYS